jgi:5-methylcytosine-specific restriction endonuclease McrA
MTAPAAIRKLVLLLNQNYEPLNVCPVRRAVVLLGKGKAEVLENGIGVIHSANEAFELPSVIRLCYDVRRPFQVRRLTRRDAFLRDRYRCQYCGLESRNLTLDHVVPRVRGGGHHWTNVVAACKRCNHRKAGRTPAEAGMVLLSEPKQPSASPYQAFQSYLREREEWRRFVPAIEGA